MIYISSTLQAKYRTDLDFEGEALWIEIELSKQKILVCAVYRQPHEKPQFWVNFQRSIEMALDTRARIIITGDLNVDLLTERNHKLNQIMNTYNLINTISEPTRVGNNGQSLLDPIIVSDDCVVHDSHVIQVDRQYSDHDATIIYIKIPLKTNKVYKRLVWNYRQADFQKCNELIEAFNWGTIINSRNSMNTNCNNFTEKYMGIVQECVPRKEVTVRPNDKLWFNSDLRREIRKRDRLHKNAVRTKKDSDVNKLKKTKKSCE